MDVNEADMAIKVIQQLNQHNEQLCQRVQDLERDNARLRTFLGRIISTCDTFGADVVPGIGLIAEMAIEALSGEVGPE